MATQEIESKINRENVKYLALLALLLFACELLNEVGIFSVAPFVMRIGAAAGIVFFLVPGISLIKSLHIFERNPEYIEYQDWHKYFILAFAWVGTTAACITLTHHTVLLMAIPIVLMAQYRNTKELVPMTIIFATMCVFLGVYGGYFWGCFDSNLLHMEVTNGNVADLQLRSELGSSDRMIDLLLHYVLPREFIVIALVLLASRISRYNNEMINSQAKLQEAVEQEMQRANEMQWQIIDGMATLIENRDASTGEHVKRTRFYVKCIVEEIKANEKYDSYISEEEAETIVNAAPLHDIGKIVVADKILRKPGKLTAEEYEEIKLHAEAGARIINDVLGYVEDEHFISAATDIAGRHHERWDGKGYPSGLSGEEIPVAARIMAVADVFDALVSERVYKSAMAPEEAFEVIKAEAGKQFDPQVVRAFSSLKSVILQSLSQEAADRENVLV